MTLRNFFSRATSNFVVYSAEQFFRDKVAEFTGGFQPEHVRLAGESGRPFEEIVAGAGFNLQPTPVTNMNPWARHLVNLPEERLLQLIEEAVSPAHVVMLRRYPEVAQGIIRYVKSMAISSGR